MGEEGRCEKIARRPRENAYVVNRDGESRCFTVNSSVEIESRLDSIDSPYFVWFLTRLRSSSFHFHLFCVTSRLRLKHSTSFLRQDIKKKKNCTSNSCETRCKMKSHRIRMVKSRYIYTHTNSYVLNINLIACRDIYGKCVYTSIRAIISCITALFLSLYVYVRKCVWD